MFHYPSLLVETLTHRAYSTMISTLGIIGYVVLDYIGATHILFQLFEMTP